jgi:hypothetical protein
VVPQVDDAADLVERETGRLSGADELHAGDRGVVVVAVPVATAGRCWQEPAALVEADGLAGKAYRAPELSDQHEPNLLS